MTSPTYGQPVIQPDDIVARLDALIPRDGLGKPLAWVGHQIPTQILLDARNKIVALSAALEAKP
jgi:hypothetical protein